MFPLHVREFLIANFTFAEAFCDVAIFSNLKSMQYNAPSEMQIIQ